MENNKYKFEKKLLKGLEQLFEIAFLGEISYIKCLRFKKNIDVIRFFVHYCLSHVVPNSI